MAVKHALLVVFVALALSASACGGEFGSSPTGPSFTIPIGGSSPPPAPSPASPTALWNALPEEEKAFLRVFNLKNFGRGNVTVRHGTIPIPIWIAPELKREDVAWGMNLWPTAVSGVSFRVVSSETEATILLRNELKPLELRETHVQCAVMVSQINSGGVIYQTIIYLEFGLRAGCDDSSFPTVRLVVAHELGHAIGIGGHPVDGGIMSGWGEFVPSFIAKGMSLVYLVPPGTRIE